jgi:hypothetical protein
MLKLIVLVFLNEKMQKEMLKLTVSALLDEKMQKNAKTDSSSIFR